MTLEEAVKEFESRFQSVTQRSTIEIRDFAPDIDQFCSGGVGKPNEVMPALFSSKDRAIEAWLDQIYKVDASEKLEWVVKPELVEYQITMADRIGRHRAVGNRYAVKSQFVAS